MDKTLTISTVHSVITQKKRRFRISKIRIRLATHQRPSVITKRFVEKLHVEISKPNPQSSRKYGVSKRTIHSHHARYSCNIEEQGEDPHAVVEAWRYVISLDETWLTLTDVDGQRDIFHECARQSAPEGHTKT
jgi:hypothetical protein